MATVEAKSAALTAEPRHARRRAAFLAVVIALPGTALALWFGLATYGARGICFPLFYSYHHPHLLPGISPSDNPRTTCGADFEEVALTRTDGLKLAAWFVPGSKPAAVILMHGAALDRRSMLPYLKFVHAAGYAAMLVDEIDNGASDDTGRGVGYGWREREDVLSAVASLRARRFARIGALGVSQGANAALLAQAQSHVLDAIVSDSAFANLGTMLRHLPSIEPLNPLFVDTMLWESGFWLGRAPDRIAPAAAVADLGNCALLVIHGANDRLVPVGDAQAIYAAARGNKELWVVPGADHGAAFAIAQDDYPRRVIAFFDRYLLGTQSGGAPR